MKILFTFCFLLFFNFSFSQQDVGVIDITAPVSGCGLSANENITVQVYNYGSIINTSFNVSYTINGGTPVSETINTTILSNSVYTYTFIQKVDLSAGGSFTINAYTDLTGDADNSNNAFSGYKVIADSFTNGGIVTGAAIVCKGSDGIVSLTAFTGSVQYWEISTNGGISWSKELNVSEKFNYTNLTTNTSFRAIVKNGVCPSDTSTILSIIAEDVPVGGTLLGTATVCGDVNNGILTLTGHGGNIAAWESSVNNGISWNTLVNAGTDHIYANLTQTTIYRVKIQNGTCPPAYSSNATISVDSPSVGGIISGSTSVCSGINSGILTLSGNHGDVVNWESSINGGTTWTAISNTSTGQNYNNLTSTTQFRAVVKSGVCSSVTSSTAVITADSVSMGGYVSGSTTVCGFTNSGILILNGYRGKITGWEYSTDGGISWKNSSNTGDTNTYTNLTITTYFRATVQNGNCPSEKSAIGGIRVDSVSDGGMIKDSPTVCEGNNSGKLILDGYQGKVQYWELSLNGGASWTTIQNSATTQSFTNITANVWYRAIVKSGSCPADTSAVAAVKTVPSPTADAGKDSTITAGESIVLNGSGGIMFAWSPGTGLNDTTISNPIATPINTTLYFLTVTNSHGCKDMDSVMITVEKEKILALKISNLISPNGDGLNDTWYIENIDKYPPLQVVIFNSQGQEIYNSKAYSNEWNGTYQGNKLPDGTYYYVLIADAGGKVFKGSITILSQ